MDLYQIVFHVGNILALINLNDEPLFYCQYKTWRFQFILHLKGGYIGNKMEIFRILFYLSSN